MKPIFYRLLAYPIALIAFISLFNIDLSGHTEDMQELILKRPFFDPYKVYYSLSVLIIISGLIEKSNSPKIDTNFLFKILFCIFSLFFYFLGYKFEPKSQNSISYNWLHYFKIIFFSSIWIGLYIQMLMKNERKTSNNSV